MSCCGEGKAADRRLRHDAITIANNKRVFPPKGGRFNPSCPAQLERLQACQKRPLGPNSLLEDSPSDSPPLEGAADSGWPAASLNRLRKKSRTADSSHALAAQAHPSGPKPGPPGTPVARLLTARSDKKKWCTGSAEAKPFQTASDFDSLPQAVEQYPDTNPRFSLPVKQSSGRDFFPAIRFRFERRQAQAERRSCTHNRIKFH